MSKKKSKNWGGIFSFEAFKILLDNDGHMSVSDLMDAVGKKVKIPPKWQGPYASGGGGGEEKWIIRIKYFSSICVKIGLIEKRDGTWYASGDLSNLLKGDATSFIQEVQRRYNVWRSVQDETAAKIQLSAHSIALIEKSIALMGDDDDPDNEPSNVEEVIDYVDNQAAVALDKIQKHLRAMDFMDFQKLCGALLRGMGYYIHEDSKRGPDGGVDVWAYSDPLGKPPSIKLQAKRYNEGKVSLEVLNDLRLTLAEGDIGIIVTSSTFAKGCEEAARKEKGKHIELIDSSRFVELWKKYYSNLSQDDRDKLPLRPVHFLDETRIKKS